MDLQEKALQQAVDISHYLKPYVPGFGHLEYSLYKDRHPSIPLIPRDRCSQTISLCQRTHKGSLMHPFLEYWEIARMGTSGHESKGLVVMQNQGIKLEELKKRGVLPEELKMPDRWDRVLLEIIIKMAYDGGYSWIGVRPAEDHPDYDNPKEVAEEEKPKIQSRMKIRYNYMPKKIRFEGNRFEFNPDLGFLVLSFDL